MFQNRITKLFSIRYPIVQAGMVWCSGHKLAAAVSNAGGLGLIGAGSMDPELLRYHVQACKANTSKPFGVNIPILYAHADACIEMVLDQNVPIVFTSAGNPSTYTATLKRKGIIVVHVVSSAKFALKAADAGVDAVVAEGFEAGGHNGREETTTLCLVPLVHQLVRIPILAAGGISSGAAMYACMALGAEGVQIGSAFAVSSESSAHPNFKNKVIEAKEGDTTLTLKDLVPTRMLKNQLFQQLETLQRQGATADALRTFMGKGRSKLGIFEGDVTNGELEIGQISALLNDIKPAADILNSIWYSFLQTHQRLNACIVP